jgi:pimeloyl-ACP methyl ester carboxylesterase
MATLQKKPLPQNPSFEVQQALVFRPETNPTGHEPFEGTADVPFDATAPTPSRTHVWWLSEAAWLAYSHDESTVGAVYRTRAGLQHCQFLTERGSDCYVAHGDRFAIVAFRGTQPDDWADLLDDARYRPVRWDVGRVHMGFADAFERVRPRLDQVIRGLPASCVVWFTGHSLGGATATLAAYRYRERLGGVCTFGSPLVGNGSFSRAFDAALGDRSRRYVHNEDMVTRVPPPFFAFPHGLFAHVRGGRWIDADGSVGDSAPRWTDVIRGALGRPMSLGDLVALRDGPTTIRLPRPLSDHTPLYYAIHCWNDLATHA